MTTEQVEGLAKKARLLEVAIAGVILLCQGSAVTDPGTAFGPIEELAAEIRSELEAEYR